MYNELETMIIVYFNALYQHFWPDLKLPWGDSCRAPVRIAPHHSPSEGCPSTCDCFAPANNTIQYNTIQGICYRLTRTLHQINIPVQMPGHFLWEWTCLDIHFAGTTWTAYSSVFSSNCDVQSGPRCPAPDREYNSWILTEKICTKSYVWVGNIKEDQV